MTAGNMRENGGPAESCVAQRNPERSEELPDPRKSDQIIDHVGIAAKQPPYRIYSERTL